MTTLAIPIARMETFRLYASRLRTVTNRHDVIRKLTVRVGYLEILVSYWRPHPASVTEAR